VRRKPYSARGISRVPCTRCGKPSEHQWNACADGQYRGVCTKCDIGLNKVALRYMRVPDWQQKVRAYQADR
jgi:hypothetical protein